MTPDEEAKLKAEAKAKAQAKAAWQARLTPKVIAKIMIQARKLRMRPGIDSSATLTALAWKSCDIFVSRFNPVTAEHPFDGMLFPPGVTIFSTAIDLPIVISLYGNDPLVAPLTGLIDEEGELRFEFEIEKEAVK